MIAWFVHNIFVRKVNTTKYIKMVSITSIETKFVQRKSQMQLPRQWLLDLQSDLDARPPVIQVTDELGRRFVCMSIVHWARVLSEWKHHSSRACSSD